MGCTWDARGTVRSQQVHYVPAGVQASARTEDGATSGIPGEPWTTVLGSWSRHDGAFRRQDERTSHPQSMGGRVLVPQDPVSPRGIGLQDGCGLPRQRYRQVFRSPSGIDALRVRSRDQPHGCGQDLETGDADLERERH